MSCSAMTRCERGQRVARGILSMILDGRRKCVRALQTLIETE